MKKLNKLKVLCLISLFLFFAGSYGIAQEVNAAAKTEAAQCVGPSCASLAEQATDPTAILTQFQTQNIFVPQTYDSTGYANQLIIQPVIPIVAKKYFPFTQIWRPTFPLSVVTADPNGAVGRKYGLGDLVLLDVFLPERKDWGTWGAGVVAVLPTATKKTTGQGKWQIGPVAVIIYGKIPKWTFGCLVENPISFAGDPGRRDVSTLLVQPIVVRHFSEGWYAGWGELLLSYEWLNKDYNIPINVRVGKVIKVFGQAINVFVEPFYTPRDLQSGSQDQWGFKLNVTFLFPDIKL
jgi:hypothetical protein